MNTYPNYNITDALAQLDEATNSRDSTFDEANKIFFDVEESLRRINIEYWYPQPLIPRKYSGQNSYAPIIANNLNVDPFYQVTYDLGFLKGRLVICKVTAKYEYNY